MTIKTKYSSQYSKASNTAQWLYFLLGPSILFITLNTQPLSGMTSSAWIMTSILAMTLTWWVTEILPYPVTALVPLLLAPLLGIADIQEVIAPYAHPTTTLFFSAFLLGLAIKQWDLHKHLTLNLLARSSCRESQLIGGIMLVTAFLSMWMSNTASTITMIPIGLSIASLLPTENSQAVSQFTKATLLSIGLQRHYWRTGFISGHPS